ncbi:MAG: hypothetical protein GY941_08895 [Planctomycetes bacterium]|nr:hypothetical protein [Planctomycetota bacterium]
MVREAKDEIIEELWCIKDKFSSSCDNNIGEIIKTMNKIAVEKGFHGKQINQRKEVKTS